MLSVLAHTSGPEEVGKFSIAMAIAGPLAILFSLSSRTLLQTSVGKDSRPFKDFWQLRLITTVLLMLAVLVVAVWRHDSADVMTIILLVGLFKSLENLCDITYGLAQRNEHDNLMSHSLFLRGLGGFAAFAGIYWLTHSLALAMLGICSTVLIIFYFHDWRLTRRWHGSLEGWDIRGLWPIVWTSLPVCVAVFISGFNIVIPRLMLEHHEGLAALGVFSSLAYLITLGNLVVNALGNTLLTKLAWRYEHREMKDFTMMMAKSAGILIALCTAGTLLAWLAGPQILTILYGAGFAQYASLMVMVAAGGSVILVGTFLGYALMATKTFTVQLWLNVAVLIGVTLAAWLLIPVYGLWGAAYTLLALGILKTTASLGNYAYVMMLVRKEAM